MNAVDVSAIPQGEAFTTLVSFTGESAEQLTQFLYHSHNIGMAWYIIAAIGTISAVGIYLYGKWLLTLQKAQRAA